MTRYVILKIESYEGDDTFVRCGNNQQDFLFAVVMIGETGTAEIIDGGYRSHQEALKAWPESALSLPPENSSSVRSDVN
jgi:hypothetical protein